MPSAQRVRAAPPAKETPDAAAFTTWCVLLVSAAAILTGGFWLAAWLGGVAPRWSAVPGQIVMKTNMALGQLLAGVALLLLGPLAGGFDRRTKPTDEAAGGHRPLLRLRHVAGTALAAVVMAIGALTLGEHLIHYDLGIDQLLAREVPGATATLSPNRIGYPGSASLALVGAGLLALAWTRRAVAPYLGLVVCAINLVPAVGFLYGIDTLYSDPLTGIAWPTVAVMTAVGLGLVVAQRTGGPVALLLRDDAGGALLRGTLPAALLIPLALGYLRLKGETLGYFDAATGKGLLTIGVMLLFGLILWRTASRLSGESAAARAAEEVASRSRQTFVELVERSPFGTYVVDSQFRIAMMNAASQDGAFRHVRPVIGRPFEEAIGILWPEPVAAEIVVHFRHTLETGESYYSPRFSNPRRDVEVVESYEWELHRTTLPDDQQGVICYYYDSTPLREAEQALRASEEKYRNLFENTEEMVTVYEVERDDNGQVVEQRLRDANRAFLRAAGVLSIDAIRGRTSSQIFGSVWSEAHLPSVQRAMDTGHVQVQEVFRPESGRHYITSVVRLDARTYLGTGRDITARRQTEQELERMRTLLAEGQQVAHVGSFEYVAATQTTVWSEEEYRIYGLESGRAVAGL